jgi:uncharacterized protein (TIGR02391 family)
MSAGPVDPLELRRLPTVEVALLLRSLDAARPVHSNNTIQGAKQAYAQEGHTDLAALVARLSDAWAWLEAHACLGPDPDNVSGGWQRVTLRGRQLAKNRGSLAAAVAEDRLAMALHPTLEAKVRPIFGLGDYETASFAAFKEVEVRVRDLAGASGSELGVPLMRQSFRKDGGPLVDADADGGEQVALMELFAGAIGTFKNPASHRTVDYSDPSEAAEVVLLADLLMRLLDRVEGRLTR